MMKLMQMQLGTDIVFWIVAGIAFLSAEPFVGTFYLMFFGMAALMTAIFASMGISEIYLQGLIFLAVSGLTVWVLRKKLIFRSRGFDPDTFHVFELNVDAPQGVDTRVKFQGTHWTAQNVSGRPLVKGDKAVVIRTQGIKLLIKPEREQ